MSLHAKTNRLGAGDGIPFPHRRHKRRSQIPSARKFATRGVVPNSEIKYKLQEALDGLNTLPQSPLRRRSLSLAEIDSSAVRKRRLSKEEPRAPKKLVALLGEADASEERRRVDAGRRVCLLLAVNAWRRRSRDLAAACESRDQLQHEADQLSLQIDVLKKLRVAEVDRVNNATNEAKLIMGQFEELKEINLNLTQTVNEMRCNVESHEHTIVNLNDSVMNERNLNVTLTHDLKHKQEELFEERKVVWVLKDEVQQLLKQISTLQSVQYAQKTSIQQLEESFSTSENNYFECMELNKSLQEECSVLQSEIDKLHSDQDYLKELLECSQDECLGFKDVISVTQEELKILQESEKKTQEENAELKNEIDKLQIDFKAQNERHWMLKTGEFLYDKFTVCAYMIFPALPRRPSPEVWASLAYEDTSKESTE